MDIEETLIQPVNYFLEFAKQAGTVFQPISTEFERISRELLSQHAPNFLTGLDEFLKTQVSPHSKNLPLMNPFDVILIIGCYLGTLVVLRIFMSCFKNGFGVKPFALFHNFFLTTLSAYMFAEVVHLAHINNYKLWGNPVDETSSGVNMAKILWIFYFSKIIEFIDTVIMMLKKNFRQVTFLHVYHHVSVFSIWWLVIFSAPGGDSYYSAAANSLVHVVMYAYYLFTALGVKLTFIKKYITQMQMFQFLTMMLQSAYDLYTGGGGYPVLPTRILFFYMVTLLTLFINFYVKDRQRQKAVRAQAKNGSKNETKKTR